MAQANDADKYKVWRSLRARNGIQIEKERKGKLSVETTWQCPECEQRFTCYSGIAYFLWHQFSKHHKEFMHWEKVKLRRKRKAEMQAAGEAPQPSLRSTTNVLEEKLQIVEEKTEVLGIELQNKPSRQSVANLHSALEEEMEKLKEEMKKMMEKEELEKFIGFWKEKEKKREEREKAKEEKYKYILFGIVLYIFVSTLCDPSYHVQCAVCIALGFWAYWYYKQTGQEKDDVIKVISITPIPDLEEEIGSDDDDDEEVE